MSQSSELQFTTEETPVNVHALTVLVCQDCIDLKGVMCNNAECVFCRRTMVEVQDLLDAMLLCPIVDGKRLILVGDAVTNEDSRISPASAAPVVDNTALVEALAALAHEQWAGWMRYLFKQCWPEKDAVIIPKDFVKRWRRQMDASYLELPEGERESDRQEARRMIEVFRANSVAATVAPVEQSDDEQLIALLLNWRKWYSEDLFTPWTIEEAQRVHDAFPGAVDRISAESARGTIDHIITDIRAGKHRMTIDDDNEGAR